MPVSTVEVPTPDGVADAYLATPGGEDQRPGGADRLPGVLFIMDAYGLRPQIEAMAERIASRGYVVLAPNVFYRAGRAPVVPFPDSSDPDARGAFFAKIRPLIEQLTPEVAERDGGAYLDYLAGVALEPVGITGYCMGARLALRIAAAHPDRVAALAGFHGGGLVTDDADSPHLSVGRLRCDAYFGHADNDRSNTPEQIEVLDRALDEAGVRHRSEVYEGALHGYAVADSPVYNEEAAQRHFAELFALLERTLGGSLSRAGASKS
jgi:carboxymethylenebutenolidase